MRNVSAGHVAGDDYRARIVRADGGDKLRAAAAWSNDLPPCGSGRDTPTRTCVLNREAAESAEQQAKRDEQQSTRFHL